MLRYRHLFLSFFLLWVAVHAAQAASSGSLRQPLRKGQHNVTTSCTCVPLPPYCDAIDPNVCSGMFVKPASRAPKVTNPPVPASSTKPQVKCLNGKPYLGPNHPCNLPIQSKLAYASGFNYSQYLRVQLQPKFHLEGVAELVDERVDPIISPGVGTVSGHTHTVFGGSNFASDLTYDKARAGQCTSISVQAGMWAVSHDFAMRTSDASPVNQTSRHIGFQAYTYAYDQDSWQEYVR